MSLLVEITAWVGRGALGLLADAVGPRGCAACDAQLARSAVFCASCALGLDALEPAPAPATSAPFAFGGPLREAIHRLKFQDRPDLARPLGELLRAHVRADVGWAAHDLVVPVPLHPARLAERGYNQAALLARSVAQELGRPLCARGLRRVRGTRAQSTLDRDERHANLRGALAAEGARVRGKAVLLVDDVVTTGSTLAACREALLAAGATQVRGLALARSGGLSRRGSAADP